jgi:hypothetical protein
MPAPVIPDRKIRRGDVPRAVIMSRVESDVGGWDETGNGLFDETSDSAATGVAISGALDEASMATSS